MARPLRVEYEDAIYHVCARGNARERTFRDERDRGFFLQLLAESAQRFDGAILCFVLMPNHFHLVAQTHRANLGRWMHWLLVSYTVFFNRRHRRSGHLFQGRYKSFLVEEGKYLLELSRYVHLNPVRGVILGQGTPSERRERLRGFKWSSYQGYAGMGRSFDFVEERTVLVELDEPKRVERARYRRYVEEGLLREIENPFEAVRWQAVLASESFAQRLRDRVQGLDKEKREMTSLRKSTPTMQPGEVLSRVAAAHKLEPDRLLHSAERGLEARNLAMWLIWQRCGMTLREIGDLFGGLDYAAVAQRIQRTRLGKHSRSTRNLLDEMSNLKGVLPKSG